MRDTIAAIATAAGPAGVGIVRVSGPKVPELGRKWLGRMPKPRHAHYLKLRDEDGGLLDQVLLLYFPAPHSYTGEDVLEVQAHGSPVLLEMILARILAEGVRRARPGEFSERAFLAGKLDLAQAEAVADLIAAQSQSAVRAALRSLSGEFSARVHALADGLLELRVWIEAAIDFPSEEIDFLADAELLARLDTLEREFADFLGACARGARLRDGLELVLLGPPNAGKSSLLNRLAGDERAIVTALPGTTRDVLREPILLDGLPITVLDTAGLREAADLVEQEGIRRARDAARRADHALVVIDAAAPPPEVDRFLAELPAELPYTVVHNKIDLSGEPPARIERAGRVHLYLSARTGVGLEALRAELRAVAGLGEGAEGGYTARARHLDALRAAQARLAAARDRLRTGQGELAAEELRCAHDALGPITGEVRSDALLGAIFGRFCIGK